MDLSKGFVEYEGKTIRITPMLEQYLYWKEKYRDYLLFFRMGDFYELFFDDARTASRELDIALTSRDQERAVPMAGVPLWSCESYLERLVRRGYRIAICDQVEESDGRNLVRREVTRIVTPGTFSPEGGTYEGAVLVLDFVEESTVLLVVYSNTGELKLGEVPVSAISPCVAAYDGLDVVVKEGQQALIPPSLKRVEGRCEVVLPRGAFESPSPSVHVEGLGPDSDRARKALGALRRYLEEVNLRPVQLPQRAQILAEGSFLRLDEDTLSHLQVLDKNGLLGVMDRCATRPGRRKLRDWMSRPSTDLDQINDRHEAIERLVRDRALLLRIRRSLARLKGNDFQASTSRLAAGSASPRDLCNVRGLLRVVPELLDLASALSDLEVLGDLPSREGILKPLEELERGLNEEIETPLGEGGVIRRGYDRELDELRMIGETSKAWLEEFVRRERERTGIKGLRVSYNKVFGYYVEVGRASASKLPDYYERKQTLSSSERFTTRELKEFEERMETAELHLGRREKLVFSRLCEEVKGYGVDLERASELASTLDVLSSLAELALERGYSRPRMTWEDRLSFKDLRHPVLDVLMDRPFVPNDVEMDESKRILIITGPNMAGKSTYLRMTALACIMAQSGSFVPAKEAVVGVLDAIYTRIGARDDILRDMSTFMMEMKETAKMIQGATSRSLLLLDEVGRGTSTYDGMSIAWALIEHLAQRERPPKTMFATHYHELSEIAQRTSCVHNLSALVEERGDGIRFLYKIAPGVSRRSYGIEVARMAGLPEAIVRRATEILRELEAGALWFDGGRTEGIKAAGTQLPLFDVELDALVYKIASLDPDNTTPLKALQIIYELKEMAVGLLSRRGR